VPPPQVSPRERERRCDIERTIRIEGRRKAEIDLTALATVLLDHLIVTLQTTKPAPDESAGEAA
jgi:hypothetical protein